MNEITIKMRSDGRGNYAIVVGNTPEARYTKKTVAAMVETVPAPALKIVLQSLVNKSDEHPDEWVSISSLGEGESDEK